MTDIYIRPEDVAAEDAERILDFLNEAQGAEDIANAVEIPHERDVGMIVAQHILDARGQLAGGKFTNLQQVADVWQVGPERFSEIVICLAAQQNVPDDVNRTAPRLLVPIRVQALVVTAQNAGDEWAEVAFNPEDEVQPGFFDTYTGRPHGVHLHWALPDGLTRGVEGDLPEEKTPTYVDSTEQAEELSGPDITFPVVPDRWLVVRMYPGPDEKDYKRRAEAWVIESEKDWLGEGQAGDQSARVTKLSDWRGGLGAGANNRRLTALGKGDPAFAAYYDNVQGMLGFHDDLAGVSEGPLSYLVVGWYSQPQNDPLYDLQTPSGLEDRLAELGWILEEDPSQEQPFESPVPELVLCHGLVTHVDPSLPTAEDREARPSASGLSVAVGNTSIEALAAVVAASRNIFGLDSVLEAFHYGLLPLLGESSGLAVLDALLHSEDFCSKPGGFVVDRLSESYLTAQAAVGPDTIPPVPATMPSSQVLAFAPPDHAAFTYPQQTEFRTGLSEILGVDVDEIRILSWAAAEGGTRIRLDMPDNAAQKLVSDLPGRALTLGDIGIMGASQHPVALLQVTMEEDAFRLFTVTKQAQFVADLSQRFDVDPDLIDLLEVAPHAHSVTFEMPFEKANSMASDAAWYEQYAQKYGVIDVAALDPNKALAKDLWAGWRPLTSMMAGMVPPAVKPAAKEFVRRAMPRYYQPRDPVVLLLGAGRSMKHGEDGYFTEEGRLVCRVTGETVNSISPAIAHWSGGALERVEVDLRDISNVMLPSGYIPQGAIDLFREALLLDPSNDWIAAKSLAAEPDRYNWVLNVPELYPHDLSENGLCLAMNVEQTILWAPAEDPDVADQTLAAPSGVNGKWPAPIALTLWRQPWTPVHLAWEVGWYPCPRLEEEWKLGEQDFKLPADASFGLDAENCITYQGRTLITPAIAAVLADRIDRLLEHEASNESDEVLASEERDLGRIRRELRKLDVLATTLGGFHDLLIGLEEKHHVGAPTESGSAIDETAVPITNAYRFPVRAGHLRLKRLRVIDAFGRFMDVDESQLRAPIRASDVKARWDYLIQLPPRIVQFSRMMFRLLQADDDTNEATKEQSPVCGWLLPDHLDEALEVFDAEGNNQGQVQMALDGAGLEWQTVPGKPGPWGGPPDLPNPHLQQIVQGLLVHGYQDSATSGGTGHESALSALLRMIDATLWAIDPLGREGGEHLSVLVGRPLAVVRARLLMELDGDAVSPDLPTTVLATGDLGETAFPVRLGQLTHLDDGLIGYFVNDDYSQFYPVHEAIAKRARAVGPRRGFLGAIQNVPEFYLSLDGADSIKEVTHPYINEAPTVPIQPGQPVYLTLLIDPRCSAVNVTSGILPRKRIELQREHIGNALDNISVSFRFGPVLVDPNAVRMPLPAEIRGYWSWVHRTGPATWQEDPVGKATRDAQLPPNPAHLSEGWLKVGGAFQEEEDTAP